MTESSTTTNWMREAAKEIVDTVRQQQGAGINIGHPANNGVAVIADIIRIHVPAGASSQEAAKDSGTVSPRGDAVNANMSPLGTTADKSVEYSPNESTEQLNHAYRYMLAWLKQRNPKAAADHKLRPRISRNQLAQLLAAYLAESAPSSEREAAKVACAMCGSNMQKEELGWYCNSCQPRRWMTSPGEAAKDERGEFDRGMVSPANELLRELNARIFADHIDIEKLPEAVGLVIDFGWQARASLKEK